jgi:Trypsin-co-occurring domain 2
MAERRVPIAVFIDALRDELTYAIASDEDRPFQFGLGTVDVELSIEATSEIDGPGRTRLWVVNGGSENGSTQKLHLSLTPVQRSTDTDLVVSGEVSDDTRRRPNESVVLISRESLPDDVRRRFEEDEYYR